MSPGRFFSNSRRSSRSGFTLTEALVCISLLGIAGSSLFLAVESTLFASSDALDETIAQGIAQQILDEVSGLPYVEKGSTPGPPVTEESVATPGARDTWDDLDDYHGYTVASPLTDRFGQILASGNGRGGVRPVNFQLRDSFFDDWRVTVTVSHVDSNNQEAAGVTDFRRLRVVIEKSSAARNSLVPWRTLATAERVFAYVPPTS